MLKGLRVQLTSRTVGMRLKQVLLVLQQLTTSGCSVNFTNPGSNDYTLAEDGSVCIAAGTATGAPAVDFAENNRNDGSIDMGAYEYSCTHTFD